MGSYKDHSQAQHHTYCLQNWILGRLRDLRGHCQSPGHRGPRRPRMA